WAEWCGPCRMLSPMVDQVADAFAGRAKVVKVNVDQAPHAAQQNGVRSIPTLVFYKDGRPVDSVVGAVPRAQIEAKLNALLAD
ncbi:MAG TPA: thioredoxin, partial [Gemmatimonadaceae bacterium]